MGIVQIPKCRCGKAQRKLWVKSDREAQFDPFAEAKRPRSHGIALSSMARTSASSDWPSGVSVGRWRERSNSAILSWPSRLAIAWLTADWTRDKRPAAARKLPDSATATKTRI
jgi:hypothetical protein